MIKGVKGPLPHASLCQRSRPLGPSGAVRCHRHTNTAWQDTGPQLITVIIKGLHLKSRSSWGSIHLLGWRGLHSLASRCEGASFCLAASFCSAVATGRRGRPLFPAPCVCAGQSSTVCYLLEHTAGQRQPLGTVPTKSWGLEKPPAHACPPAAISDRPVVLCCHHCGGDSKQSLFYFSTV